ncbi:pyrophosphate--fructose-6-phosphate 1-phosphotransferase [Actinomyces sp. zg-332]|uniref:pyrophosphate--fructose-6-phosphate 1-phosphotransferase n=1 Tax=Actinomyces sp. zg-332 TaxID=2708340 RepID=UPI00141E46B8|nr:pyrophosphate--fructose-6-phosphate 1-phosphotransferase [Actinomyces sp. zg-332]QPK94641.1 pyrophosphate--fructose-6-phosphate 1-phosphotransferase [Actinomyces sp. zg-332]
MTQKPVRKVAFLTAGGFAPCLSSAVAFLIKRYNELDPQIEMIGYEHGYHGLLTGTKIVIDERTRQNCDILHEYGGSPIGNSRVKLTNVKNLVQRGLIEEGENPLEKAAKQLVADGVDVLHTIGGDDTNTTAADLAAYLAENDYDLTVVGLPKTIDNDIIPIRQSLGAITASHEAAKYAHNIISEHRSNPRMLIIHEIMGRNCGWLTAAATKKYHDDLKTKKWLPSIGLCKERYDVHAVFVPELHIDIEKEAARLKAIMDEQGNVNIFLSEGAGVADIVKELENSGEEVQRDPFGHVMLDKINPGQWFAKQFAKLIGAEKVMVQKSGYFSRSAAASSEDLRLIQSMTTLAVESALKRVSGVVGHDEENGCLLSVIAFDRIAGGKKFNVQEDWFQDLLKEIGQE